MNLVRTVADKGLSGSTPHPHPHHPTRLTPPLHAPNNPPTDQHQPDQPDQPDQPYQLTTMRLAVPTVVALLAALAATAAAEEAKPAPPAATPAEHDHSEHWPWHKDGGGDDHKKHDHKKVSSFVWRLGWAWLYGFGWVVD